MIRRPPRSTRTDTLFPYTTLFRSLYAERAGRSPARPPEWCWIVRGSEEAAIDPDDRAAAHIDQQQVVIMTDIAQPGARARDTPARIVVEAIGGCIIAAVQPVAGCETVIFERRAPVRIALVALPVAPVLAIFLAPLAQVAALFAAVAALAV